MRRRAVAPLRYSAVLVTPEQVAERAARTAPRTRPKSPDETKLPEPKPRVAAEVTPATARHPAPLILARQTANFGESGT
jgi:hypothetical protein